MSDVYYALYPDGLPTQTVRLLDGTRIHCRTSESGQIPVILVHGYASSSVIWEKFQILLSSRYRSLAPDIRGYGLSDKPAEGYGYHELAEDLAQFMRSLKIRQAVLIGHGFGGSIVQYFAIRYPERVLALVLVGSSALHLPQQWLETESPQRIEQERSTALRELIPRFFDAGNVTEEDREHFIEAGLKAGADALGKTLTTIQAAPSVQEKEYRQLKMPVLLVVGSHDPFGTFQHAVALSDVVARSRIVVMARCGYSPMWEKPIEFVKAVTEFLGENGLK